MNTKICNKCGVEKSIEEFRKYYSFLRNKYYYRNECYECEAKYKVKQDKIKGWSKKWHEEHKEFYKEYSKKYWEEHKEVLNKKRKEYFKKYRELNKEIIKEKKRKYYIEHKKQINEKQKNRKKNDKMYKLICNIRNNLLASFKKHNYKKPTKTEKIIGLKNEDFVKYLLKTFKDKYEYEWDGKEPVHIDHIYPISKARTEEEVIKLCNYKNLRLLKAKDNLEKGAKILEN